MEDRESRRLSRSSLSAGYKTSTSVIDDKEEEEEDDDNDVDDDSRREAKGRRRMKRLVIESMMLMHALFWVKEGGRFECLLIGCGFFGGKMVGFGLRVLTTFIFHFKMRSLLWRVGS